MEQEVLFVGWFMFKHFNVAFHTQVKSKHLNELLNVSKYFVEAEKKTINLGKTKT